LHIAILYSSDIDRGVGTSERILQIAKELADQSFQVTLGAARYSKRLLRSENIEVIAMPPGKTTILQTFKWLCTLVARGLTFRYDIVQVEALSTTSLVMFFIFRLVGKRFVMVFHDKEFTENNPQKNFSGKLRLLVQRIVLIIFDASITPGLSVKNFFARLHGRIINEKMIVIPNGIPNFNIRKDIDNIGIRRKYGLDIDAFIVLFFGAMTFHPNYETAFYIYGISDSICKQFEKTSRRKLLFVIAGLGTEALPKTDCFIPIGYVEELDELFTLPDAIVLPHAPSYSGPHVKTSYAFLSGKPVVATKDAVKDIEYVVPKKNFLLIDHENPGSLLQALEDLRFDPQLGKNLACNAYLDSQKFTWKYVASLHVRLYQELLS
jgi:glycosyltransferase involved in cell wall biosynthesis